MANGWKQPMPTDIQWDDRFSFIDRALLREILTLCQRQDGPIQFNHAGKHYAVELKRGQCILKLAVISRELGIDRKSAHRKLDFISKWYTEMNIKGMPFGCIITVKDYDRLTEMDNKAHSQRTMKEQSKDNERTAKETVETVENVETVNNTIPNGIGEPKEYGNPNVNLILETIKTKFNLPILDGTLTENRRYAYLCLNRFKSIEAVILVIDTAKDDQFWANKISSVKQIYYNAVKIMSSAKKGGGLDVYETR